MRILTALLFLLSFWGLQSAFAQQSYPVRFTWGTEFFPDNYQAIRQNPDIQPGDLVNGYYTRYIQCSEIPTARLRAALEQEGVQFISYVTFGAYLVALPEKFDLNKLELLHVRSIVPVKPRWKMAQNLREEPYGDWAVHGDQIDVILQLYPHVRIPDGAELCRLHGMTVILEGTQNGFLHVRLLKDHLEALAALPFVRYMELLPEPGEPEDVGGRALHRSNLLDMDAGAGIKYDGSGVVVMVRDDGPLGPHIDFKGRNTNLFASSDVSNSNHGDGVGGVMAGAGNLNPVMKGMAAGADIFTIRYEADFQDNTLPLHFTDNVTITNSSYSNGCNAGYTTITQTVEQQLQDNPTLMHVFSAGNSNGQNCDYGAGNQWGNITGGHKVAKNCIATANVFADGALVGSSSRGPAHDGRLKPDITAHGQNQNSTDQNNTYQVFGGTSAAAPGIAGCMAQLTQAYKEMYGEEPTAALLKTAIMATANDLGNAGPDFKFGWGHVNAWRAYQLLKEKNWLEDSVENGAETTHTIQVPAGTELAKIMLYWVEPPASQNAARALINDLDITVTAPDGSTVYLPWKLDPTPDPTILNTPAGKGRDSLNNVEQVAIELPAAGEYTVTIKGFEVPMGPQPYYLAWEFYDNSVKITYPAGGEGLVPGEETRIQWDAYGTDSNFTLRYSPDNGQTWLPITTTSGANRMFDWTTPNLVNSQIRLLLIRGNKRDTTDYPLSIVPVPKNIGVDRVCPDGMTVSWTAINDTLSYDVYLLGQKYMEIVGTSDTTVLTFPVPNPLAEQWISVRASHANGLTGRRAIAIRWPGGALKDCRQPDDVNIGEILSPSAQSISSTVSCDPFLTSVTARVVNDGENPIDGALLNYQLNNEPVVTEALPVIDSGATLDFTFMQQLTISENGLNTLRVWSTYGVDDFLINDTLVNTFLAVVSPETQFFSEDFQSANFPPQGWAVGNPDNEVTWERSATVTGSSGLNTRATYLNCFDYDGRGEEDYLYMLPVDLNNLPDPGLRFDLAHANYNGDFSDSLRVEVFANCDLNTTPAIIWVKGGPTLATTASTTGPFAPNDDQDWRTEAVDLHSFAGQTVIIRFVSVNDYGNNIYLDNIGLFEYNLSPPVAEVILSADTACRLDDVMFTALDAGPLADYKWLFGTAAQPSSATGPGPHEVSYLTPGSKNVRLIVSNPNGVDTSLIVFPVLGPPIANFSWSADAGTVTFTNNSSSSQTFLWEFGDGMSSTEANPVHTYAAPGNYTVKLTATNICSSASRTQSFNLTFVGVQELPEVSNVQILPNPTEGDFRVELTSLLTTPVQFHLLDAQGRLVKSMAATTKPGKTTVPFEGLNLPKGLYQLQLQTQSGDLTFSVAVQ
ncbi:MAG: S8 family serine peptidase [Lewinellaceae bacterium]|nr:S8 family serine peptidase [Lewinellaceae bacterium]